MRTGSQDRKLGHNVRTGVHGQEVKTGGRGQEVRTRRRGQLVLSEKKGKFVLRLWQTAGAEAKGSVRPRPTGTHRAVKQRERV